MTRDGRLLLLLQCLLIAYDLLVVQCRYHHNEDVTRTEVRHRHRHKHNPSARRSYHDPDKKIWQDIDYEYYGDFDDSPGQDDYEIQSYYDHLRSHQRSIQRNYHSRISEPHYPVRHPHSSGRYHGNVWYKAYNNDRRRIPSRYNLRNHQYRLNKPTVYSRNYDTSEFDDDMGTDFDYERPYRYSEIEGADKRHDWRQNARRHAFSRRDGTNRMSGSRYDKHRFKHHEEDIIDRDDTSREADNWQRRLYLSEGKIHHAKGNKKIEEDDDDYEDHGGLEEADKDENDDDDIWKDIEDEDDKKKKSDNVMNEQKLPLTYDDMIRRLTETVTPKASAKRDYRNTEVDKRMKYNGHGHINYESRNITKPTDSVKITSASRTSVNYLTNKQIAAENSAAKSANVDGRKPKENAIIGATQTDNDDQWEKSTVTKSDDTKTTSLEDYDEYLNVEDNEKDEDLLKDEIEDLAMQDDVTNADYTDDDNDDEDDTVDSLTSITSTNIPSTTTTTTIMTTTTTTTTTTTPKLLINQQIYPPISAYTKHKWLSLGTRESVQKTRSNYYKNGRSLEKKEANDYAAKVHKEGNCLWPRARIIQVRDVYPNPSINYFPHCAILHRCSDDTGCCVTDSFTCVPQHTHRVELFFYVNYLDKKATIQKLSFYNHTKCECKVKSANNTISTHNHTSLPPLNIQRLPPRKPCRCPSEFTSMITPEGICQCNCNENDQNCLKNKLGKGILSLDDRICIQNKECAMPNCEFGEYMKREGKCPRKKDKINAIFNSYRTNSGHKS